MKIKKICSFLLILFALVTLVSCGEVTVKFNTNGGTDITDQTISGVLNEPIAPTKDGYTFKGWYTDAIFTGEPYTFGSKVKEELTLYAKWEINTYVVTFDIKEYDDLTGNDKPANPSNITVEYSTKVSKPGMASLKSGYEIAWFKNSALSESFDFNTEIKANTTVYGKISCKTYTIKFNVPTGVDSIADVTVKHGQNLYDAFTFATPTKEGYEFGGLYQTANYEKDSMISSTNYPVNKNQTLYVQMVEIKEEEIPTREDAFEIDLSDYSIETITPGTPHVIDSKLSLLPHNSSNTAILESVESTTIGNLTFTKRFKTAGGGTYGLRAVQFTSIGAGTLIVYVKGASSNDNAILQVYSSATTALSGYTPVDLGKSADAGQKVEINIAKAGTYSIFGSVSIGVYKVQFVPIGDADTGPEEPVDPEVPVAPANPNPALTKINFSDLNMTVYTTPFPYDFDYGIFTVTKGDTDTSKIDSGNYGSLDYRGTSLTFSKRWNSQGSVGVTEGIEGTRAIKFTATGAGELYVICSSSGTTKRNSVLYKEVAGVFTAVHTGEEDLVSNSSSGKALIKINVNEAGTYYFGSVEGGIIIYLIEFVATP